jgi:hypothetical protein
MARAHRGDGRGEAGPAGADDGDALPALHPAQRLHLPRQPELAHRRQADALVQHLEVSASISRSRVR